MNDDGAVRVRAVALRVTDKVGNIEYFPFGFMRWVVGFRLDEHVATKQGLPSGGSNHFDREVVITVRSNMHVLHPGLGLTGVGFNTLPKRVKTICVERSVHAAPVDRLLAGGLFNDKAICRRSTGAGSGFDSQRAGVR